MRFDQINAILGAIKCLDRLFAIELIGTTGGPDVEKMTTVYAIRVEYMERDVDTGEMEIQRSRQWFVTSSMTESDIVDTAFACVMRSYDHVVQEHFTYKGWRVFSPHFSIKQRLEMVREMERNK